MYFVLCPQLQSVEANVVANLNSVHDVSIFSSWMFSSISAFMCRMIYCGYSIKIQTFFTCQCHAHIFIHMPLHQTFMSPILQFISLQDPDHGWVSIYICTLEYFFHTKCMTWCNACSSTHLEELTSLLSFQSCVE